MKIREIKPTILKPMEAAAADPQQTLRVAAYCRTSTDRDEQETSFEAQKTHFTSVIEANPNWKLVDIYADEESGTRVYKRENFLRMIKDCEDGKIDLILAKSISRFARNTLDSLRFLRKLESLGVVIIFMKEGINTSDKSGELLISVMSAIAQQESASISQNVQLGLRYHFQEGKLCGGVHNLLGYERTPEASLRIIFDEAETVRRIFRMYIDGYSMRNIAHTFNAEHVPGKNGKPRNWNASAIQYILTNEKYMGDLMLQKYYTVDFLTKKVRPNKGELPRYYVEDNHPPIVPKEVFLLVQGEIERRKEAAPHHHMALSGRCICGYCSQKYKRWGSGKYTYWRCGTKLAHQYQTDACEGKGVRESELQELIVRAFNLLPFERDELVAMRKQINEETLVKADVILKGLRSQIKAIEESETVTDAEREELIGLNTQYTAVSRKRAEFAARERQIRDLLERIDFIEDVEPEGVTVGANCSDEAEFYRRTRRIYPSGLVTEYVDDDVRRFVERIILYKEKIEVEFKAGVTVTVERDS